MLLRLLELEGNLRVGLLLSTSLNFPSSGSKRTAGTGGWWWSIPLGQCVWPARQPTASPTAQSPCAFPPEFPRQGEGKQSLGPGRPPQLRRPSSSPPCQAHCLPRPIQILEYQTDVQRCRFDTLGKSTPAHCAGAPTARERWVAPARWVSPIVRSPLWQVHPPCGSTSN